MLKITRALFVALFLLSNLVWANWTIKTVSGSIVKGSFLPGYYIDGVSSKCAMQIYISTDGNTLNALSFHYDENENLTNVEVTWNESGFPVTADLSFEEPGFFALSMPTRPETLVAANTTGLLIATVKYDVTSVEEQLNFDEPAVNAAYATTGQKYSDLTDVVGPAEVGRLEGFGFSTCASYATKSYKPLEIDATDSSHFSCVAWDGDSLRQSTNVKFSAASVDSGDAGVVTIQDGKIVYSPSGFVGNAVIQYTAVSTDPSNVGEVDGEVAVEVAENIPEWHLDLVAGSIVNGNFVAGKWFKNVSTASATQIYVSTDDNVLNSLSTTFNLPSNLSYKSIVWGEDVPPSSGNASCENGEARSVSLICSMPSRDLTFIPANTSKKLLATVCYDVASADDVLALNSLPTINAAYSTIGQNCTKYITVTNQNAMSVMEGFYFATKKGFSVSANSVLSVLAYDASHFECKIWNGTEMATSSAVAFVSADVNQGGKATVLDNGAIIFIPEKGFTGVSKISYTVMPTDFEYSVVLSGSFDVSVNAAEVSVIEVDENGNLLVDTQDDFRLDDENPLAPIPGNILMRTKQGLEIASPLEAGGDIQLVAEKDIRLVEDIAAEGNVDIDTEGSVSMNGAEAEKITVCTGKDLEVEESVEANDICFTARGNIAVQDCLVATGDIKICAVEGEVAVRGDIRIGENLAVEADGDLRCFEDVEAGRSIMLSSNHDVELYGKVSAGECVTIVATNDLYIAKGVFAGFDGEDLYIQAGRQITICESAFENAAIGDLDFTHNYLSIEKNAFKGCSGLTTLKLPFFVQLGDAAFANCADLEKVYFPSAQVLDAFPDNAFENCKSTLEFYVNSTGPEDDTWNGIPVVYLKGEGETEVLQKENLAMKDAIEKLTEKIEAVSGQVADFSQKDVTIVNLTKQAEDTEKQLTELLELLHSGELGQVLTATANNGFNWAELPSDFSYATNNSFQVIPGWNMLAMPELELTESSVAEFLKHGVFYHFNELNKTYERLKTNRLEPRGTYWFYFEDDHECTIHYRTLEK